MIKKVGILLLGILALLFCFQAVSIYFAQDAYAAGNYDREDYLCPDHADYRTVCIPGGSEVCTAIECEQFIK